MSARTRRHGRPVRLVAWLLIGLTAAGPGCSRKHYRDRADRQVKHLLEEKQAPEWDLDGYHLDPDIRARFADDTNRDRPPMPPDDPAASRLCPNPQKPSKKSGTGLVEGTGYMDLLDEWDRANRAEHKDGPEADDKQGSFASLVTSARNPTPEDLRTFAERQARRELADPVTTQGTVSEEEVNKAISRERTFLIKLEQAVELGLINSREYQTRREQLYLAALPVTLERFAFTPQLFATEVAIRERVGRDFPTGPARRWRLDTTAGFSQLFSTGALLLLSFANRTVINLGRNRPDTSISTLSLDVVQPLLRGAGRAVTLEPWTQAERNLLYAIRDFARFKQEFYVFVAAGQPTFIPGVEAGVQAITGGTVSAPGVFIPGAVPVVAPINPPPGAFPPAVTPGDGGRLFPTGAGGAPPQGYLSTLTQKAQLINQYRNIVSLGRYLQLFRVYLEGGLVDAVQVGQVEQQMLQGINNVLSQQASFRNNLDQFKLQLGIPLNIPLEVDDGPLQPLFDQTRRYEDITTHYEQLVNQAQQYAAPAEAKQLRERLRKLLTGSPLVRGTAFAKDIEKRWAEWSKLAPNADPKKDELGLKLQGLIKSRDELRKRRDDLRDKGQDLPKNEAARLDALEQSIDLGLFEQALRNYERRLWEAQKNASVRAAIQVAQFNTVYRLFLSLLEEPRAERLGAIRPQWPNLPTLCVDGVDLLRDDDDKALAAVTRAALENRIDLMNRRAQLHDSWRKIAVAANALLGTLNVEYHYDASSPAGALQPFALGGSRQRHQLIFNAELPLVRIAERNNYRAALIAYQQQRRALQLAEDQVLFAVRLELRQLRASANNYHKVQKRAVELAYQQVAQALEAFSQPQAPAGPAAPPGSVGAPGGGGRANDPAALTQQLLQAQSALLRAQNDLYNTWIGYVTTRMSLYRDVGLMPLDPRGVWLEDEVTRCDQPCAPGVVEEGKCEIEIIYDAASAPPSPRLPKRTARSEVNKLPPPQSAPIRVFAVPNQAGR